MVKFFWGKVDEVCYSLGDVFRLALGWEEEVLGRLGPDFFDAAHVAGNAHKASSHGFQQSIGEAFACGRKQEDIGSKQALGNIGHKSVPGNGIRNPQVGSQLGKGWGKGAGAIDIIVEGKAAAAQQP